MNIGDEYLKIVIERFKSVKSLGGKTINQLSEEEIYWTYNDESNSVAIIVKHLSGNMVSRWTNFLTSDGEKEYRNRDEEFLDDISSKSELTIVWEKGWQTLIDTLTGLSEQDLLKKIYIRGEGHSVIEAIERQMAHYAYHVGQIVYIGKQVKNKKWESLSIPKGKSEEHLKQMLDNHREQTIKVEDNLV
ncbi:DUF1572 domain-containing protein [Peribacillus muralis]|uniref:DUF1572 domain-containing protein n=1 Tax=Peribacillus muralis TaxID=264697 RepID=UPI00070CB766|nr:DUF1572 domain-containing protein [Peribacillus muralis]